jgi:hypothetical protein
MVIFITLQSHLLFTRYFIHYFLGLFVCTRTSGQMVLTRYPCPLYTPCTPELSQNQVR